MRDLDTALLSGDGGIRIASNRSVGLDLALKRTGEGVRMTRVSVVHRGLVAGSLSALILLGGIGSATAQTSADDQALATVLFEKGRQLISEGQVSQACPAFEESERLDPSGGTILNLALCHELEGR
ncbi:MAG TPA: hypothetical protein VKO16_12645, partial [Polyangia bacterium]|nr:hypothetical protein [Polyangia bacterium]